MATGWVTYLTRYILLLRSCLQRCAGYGRQQASTSVRRQVDGSRLGLFKACSSLRLSGASPRRTCQCLPRSKASTCGCMLLECSLVSLMYDAAIAARGHQPWQRMAGDGQLSGQLLAAEGTWRVCLCRDRFSSWSSLTLISTSAADRLHIPSARLQAPSCHGHLQVTAPFVRSHSRCTRAGQATYIPRGHAWLHY